MIGMICGRYFLSVVNCVLVLVVQFMYILCIDMGSLWNDSSNLMPNLAICIDFSRGVHDADMDDFWGLHSWSPFCDMGRHANSMTYSGMLSLDAISLQRSFTMVLMCCMCSEL